MRDYNKLLEGIPDAVRPVHKTLTPNIDISLYEGPIRLHHANTAIDGSGHVQLKWTPTPRISFAFSGHYAAPLDLTEEVQLELIDRWPGERISGEVLSMSMSTSAKAPSCGGTIPLWTRSETPTLKNVTFHLTNFRHFRGTMVKRERTTFAGRMTLTCSDWRVFIDEVGPGDLFKELRGSGGFAITHVGRVERVDGAEFTAPELEDIWNRLYWFLSFCNGRWTGPLLPVGYTTHGEEAYIEWGVRRCTRYGAVRSWFPDFRVEVAEQGYLGFANLWSRQPWAQALKNTIYWYITANSPGGAAENGVVLTHIAFDTLGWAIFVEDTRSLTSKAYNDLPATEKLRRVLAHCGIPLHIPNELGALLRAAQDENWADGPQAITKVRNAFVHPSISNRNCLARIGQDAESEAFALGMYYLELVLLFLLDYRDKFSSRLVGACFAGSADRDVPWK